MNHLTEEQFEDIMQGKAPAPLHLDECKSCRDRLAENKAIAKRLQSAFSNVQPDAILADKIRGQLKSGGAATSTPNRWLVRLLRQPKSVLSAAAGILIVLVPIGLYLAAPSQAHAAQAQLVNIHKHNLGHNEEFYSDSDPQNLAAYFKSKLGFIPAFPSLDNGMSIRGCCITHFREQIVGSYVVDTPQGVISVIVVTDTPESIGMTRIAENTDCDRVLWKSFFAKCEMAAVHMGGYSYCAVGEVPHEMLANLLCQLLSEMHTPAL